MSCILTSIEYQDVNGWWKLASVTSSDSCGYTKHKSHNKIPGLIQYIVNFEIFGGAEDSFIVWGGKSEERPTCEWVTWSVGSGEQPNTHGPYITKIACNLIKLYFDGHFDVPEPPPEEPPIEPPEEPPDEDGPSLVDRVLEWTLTTLGLAIDDVWKAVQKIPQKVAALVSDSLSFMEGIFDDIKIFISGVSTAFTSLKDNLIDSIKEMWVQIQGFFESAAAQIKTAIEGVIDKLTEIVGDVWEWIKDLGRTLVDGIKEAFSWVSEHVKDLFSTVWNAIKDFALMVKDAIVDVYENLKKAFVAAWEWVRDGFLNIKDTIIEGIEKAIQWVKDVVNDIIQGLKEFFSDFMEALEKMWVGFTEWWEEQWNPDNPKVIEQMIKAMKVQRKALEILSEEMP